VRAIVWIKALLWMACLAPAFYLLYLFRTDSLGTNPIETITHETGDWTLRLLLVTLSVSPLRKITGWAPLIKVRRLIGLFAFFYGVLHLFTYLWLDQFFDWPEIVKDVGKRPFIFAGMAAFLMMVPLAATSTAWAIRKMGGKNWQRLHRLIYLSAIAGVVHYWWLVKSDISEPLQYAIWLGGVLALRLVLWGRERRQPARSPRASSSTPETAPSR
jgi:methionine sulfoxide reductase heme-binding subunit